MRSKISFFAVGCILDLSNCSGQNSKPMSNLKSQTANPVEMAEPNKIKTDTATLAAGCFWCVEAVFQNLNGVLSVTSGYSGGTVPNPSYKQVCGGETGHAEACNIVYDPSK